MARWKNPLYKTWYYFYDVTTRQTHSDWPRYGARGIQLAPEWNQLKVGFDNFSDWVNEHLGPRPTAKHKLSRIDYEGNIEPGNLCWRTNLEIARQSRTSIKVKYRGEEKNLTDWSKDLNMNYFRVQRHYKRNHTLEGIEK